LGASGTERSTGVTVACKTLAHAESSLTRSMVMISSLGAFSATFGSFGGSQWLIDYHIPIESFGEQLARECRYLALPVVVVVG
jgi:hypothetical protein